MWSRRALRRLGTAVAVGVALLALDKPPARNAVELDVFAATAHEVDLLRSNGAVPVCRVPAAVWEPHRPDAARFPQRVLGTHAGPGGQRWLDLGAWQLLSPVLSARLRLCQEKGFEAVTLGGTSGPGDPAGAGWDRFAARLAEIADELGLAVR